MSVLDREALEASPLADLHTIASELSIDGYRRLRKADLVDLILSRQGGEPAAEADDAGAEEPGSGEVSADAEESSAGAESEADPESESGEESGASARRRRGRRGGRGRAARAEADDGDEEETEERPARAERSGRGERSGRSERSGRETRESKETRDAKETRESKDGDEAEEPTVVAGTVELLSNGSGFVRVSPPDPSDDDVYISAAQVKRCELVAGDAVSGPRRPPQRSERFASLVRIDTINGQPADEVADRAKYDDLDAAFPSERFKLASTDETLKAVEFLTPLGRGSRVSIVGDAWAGKSHTLRDLATALVADPGLSVFVALVGVRPEELSDWTAPESPLPTPAAALSFASSTDAQDHAVELVIDQAKRVATRGGDAVVLIDSLDGLHPHTARKAMAAARNLASSGSLTIVATASAPLGGETTVIALDAALASTARFPALDLIRSGTLRPELLVGEAGATAIAEARIEAQGA